VRLGEGLRYDQRSIYCAYVDTYQVLTEHWEAPFWSSVADLREPLGSAESELSSTLGDRLGAL
jgi:hypothetical protein